MYRSGAFVADHVEPVGEAQVQPNGVDLTFDAVFEQTGRGTIECGDKHVGARERVGTSDTALVPLSPGGYVLRYAETVHVPEGHVGFVYPRSSLMRNSCMLHTAVWDAGYEGRGEGLFEVHHPIDLEPGARVAQLVLARADHSGTYEGSYQGENL